jgi:hypothetical protein
MTITEYRCKRCGTTLPSGRTRYCDGKCRASQRTVVEPCWTCAEPRTIPRSLIGHRIGRFCNDRCYAGWMAQQPKSLSAEWLAMGLICDLATGCWLWRGIRGDTSAEWYGTATSWGRYIRVHRLSYELHVGPIPDGLRVLHKCDVKVCVRPDHLYLGTQSQNMRDVWQRQRHVYAKR